MQVTQIFSEGESPTLNANFYSKRLFGAINKK